jgi:formylglycine-generating enzyme required for sulfatase activity
MGVALAVLLVGSGAGIALSLAPKLIAPPPAVAPADPTVLTLSPGVTLTLVRVPAGVFLMGSLVTDTEASDDEKPQRRVYLEEFWIGRYEVTNAQYAAFARATGRTWSVPAGEDNYPVTDVSWDDAEDFCLWVSRVTDRLIRLPTEAQWEKAARGPDGREFPWGEAAPDAARLNYDLLEKRTTPVGRYGPRGDSPYGAADLVGNVWEWTSSLYRPYPYRGHDGREDPRSRDLRVLRGGSFVSERLYARAAVRGDSLPDARGAVMGFRVSMVPTGSE